jgi:hypothetical protein
VRLGHLFHGHLPLIAAGEALGWLLFGAICQEHAWSAGQARRLRLLAGVFAPALLLRRKELELGSALAESRALRERLEAENAAWRDEVRHCGELPLRERRLRWCRSCCIQVACKVLLNTRRTGAERRWGLT